MLGSLLIVDGDTEGDGNAVGWNVGDSDGIEDVAVGSVEGPVVGWKVGRSEGIADDDDDAVGESDGAVDGTVPLGKIEDAVGASDVAVPG